MQAVGVAPHISLSAGWSVPPPKGTTPPSHPVRKRLLAGHTSASESIRTPRLLLSTSTPRPELSVPPCSASARCLLSVCPGLLRGVLVAPRQVTDRPLEARKARTEPSPATDFQSGAHSFSALAGSSPRTGGQLGRTPHQGRMPPMLPRVPPYERRLKALWPTTTLCSGRLHSLSRSVLECTRTISPKKREELAVVLVGLVLKVLPWNQHQHRDRSCRGDGQGPQQPKVVRRAPSVQELHDRQQHRAYSKSASVHVHTLCKERCTVDKT